MLHSDSRRVEVSGTSYIRFVASSEAKQERPSQSSAELSQILSQELSPNKRAIIETLINAWGSSAKVYS